MPVDERDAFLREQRICRLATVNRHGRPHVSPLWYVWDGSSVWIYSLTRSQRWTDLLRHPQVALVVDAGETYGELRGVELSGRAEPVGEQPRSGDPNSDLEEPERLFSAKYRRGEGMRHDGRHAWVRVRPEREYTWDFRKIG